MYSRSAESVASSVSPPPRHMGSFPRGCAAAGIHLNVWPPSRDRHTYETSAPRLPGALVYIRPRVSRRRSCSKPQAWIPLIVGLPNVGRGGAAAATGWAPPDGSMSSAPSPAIASLATPDLTGAPILPPPDANAAPASPNYPRHHASW